jgi:hypothetical protein
MLTKNVNWKNMGKKGRARLLEGYEMGKYAKKFLEII